MIRLSDPDAPVNPPRPADGAPATPAAPRGFTSDQALFRLDLMRSLRMHRRIAMGFALAGLVLAAIYMVSNWSVYAAQSLVSIQPPPSALIEAPPTHWPYNYDPAMYDSYIEQHMLSMTRPDVLVGDSAPSAAHLAEAAVPPPYPASAGVVRIALLLMFAFISLGLAAAIVAHKLDPRVYVAADVEQLLGYAPMAQLPDFDEFSDEVAEEHLLRLATGIEFACKDGQLTTCVFTGTGPGVGVTTIVTRVKEMLGLLGRKAVLVDAAGPVPAEQPSGMNDRPAKVGTEFERNTWGSALMPHIGEGAPSARECLMLTDTAPLTVSAEAEHLARRADCTILVIESGVTTRAQLRAAASSLQRLNAAAVGFVLNRVSLKNADESFRHSVSEMERHLRVQGRTAARTVAQSPRIVAEAAHPSPVREIPVLAETAAAAAVIAAPAEPPARQAAPGWAAPERAAIAPKPLPEPAPEPPTPVIDEPIPQPVSWAEVAPRAQKPQEETPHWLTEEPPWWMTKAPTHVHPAMELPRAPRVEALYAADALGGQTPATAEVREEEKAADEVPTRLSALRGLLFSLGVKELSQEKDAGRNGNGNGAPADAAPVDPEQTIVAEALAPWPEPAPAEAKVEAKAEETSARKGTPRRVTAEPEFLPPPVEETNKGKESRWNRGNDDTGARDDIQILPSRRGQYRG